MTWREASLNEEQLIIDGRFWGDWKADPEAERFYVWDEDPFPAGWTLLRRKEGADEPRLRP